MPAINCLITRNHGLISFVRVSQAQVRALENLFSACLRLISDYRFNLATGLILLR